MKNSAQLISQCVCSFARKIQFPRLRNSLVALLVLLGLTAIVTFSTTGYAERLANKFALRATQNKSAGPVKPGKATLTTDRGSYLAGETITFTGTNWAPGEAVTINISADAIKEEQAVQVTADKSGAFTATVMMPEVRAGGGGEKLGAGKRMLHAEESEEPAGSFTATATGASSKTTVQAHFSLGIAERDGDRLLEQEGYWLHRLSYPTGRFNPAWVRQAAEQDTRIPRRIPAGRTLDSRSLKNNPLALSPAGFTALGPQPLRMTGCSGCFDYALTEGRVNAIAIDPTTTTNGSIVAYIATVGGGVWKTTTCCSGTTSWTALTDDALISTTSVDSVVIDPNNHNTIYAGTGDLNFGSFSMGSQGILKSTDAGATWTVLGASVFGAALPQPAGQFPQYQAVGKVRVDPNNSNNIVAGTKTGLYLSYDGGTNWTGPCLTNSFNTMRQDITGLELSNISGATRIIAAVGVRGFATTVQYNLDQNGANGVYKGTIPASGCPTDFTSIAGNANGFVFGTTVTGSPYTTAANLNAGSGVIYGGVGTGNQIGRIDIAVAPSDPNYIYAQVASIAANNNSGCGNTAGCQLGVWSTIDGGTTWSFMAGSAGGALRNCLGTNTSGNPGDYPQNWYNQGMTVDPNNPDRIFIDTYDTWLATRTGTSFYNVTCGYNGSAASNHVVHVDHHALAFVPGSSSILLEGSDGGIFSSTNADTAVIGTTRNTWVNMDTGINTIEFYSGDISANFATSAAPQANGGAQDNGSMSVTFTGSPTGPVQWQMGRGGDGFTARIDPVGTGTSLRFWQGNNSGSLGRCITNCTASGATWTTKTGGWTSDTQNFVLPYDLFHGGIPGGDDCTAAGAGTGCGHLIAGSTRVFETITGAAANNNGTVTWVITNNPTTQNLTKGTLGNRSFINQVKYSPKFQSVAIVGTNDGNVQIGFNLGTGVAAQGNWVNVTGGNAILPNRPVLGIALDPTVAAANLPVGYAAVGGFDQNTPTTPGHIFRVTCTAANCASFTWADKSGNLPNIPVDSIIVNPNFAQQVFAGTDFGLYFTDDVNVASPIWYRFNAGLPNTMIWDMQIDRGSTALSLWTRSRGAFAWPLPQGRVNLLSQTITVNTHAPATAVHGSQFTVAGTSDSGLPVSYSSAGSCTNSGATFTMVSGTGNCLVKYDQPGDQNYAPATQVVETVVAQECPSPTNVALASYGATALGSSTTANNNFPASGAIDGEHNGNNWGSGGGWNDGTRSVFPDNLQVTFNSPQTIGEIDVYTLKNDFNSGSVVTDSTTFTNYGNTSFNVQYWTGSAWADIPGGAVTGNNLVKRKFVFPDITTDKIRVVVNDSADHLFSRIVELEAYACTGNPPPPPPTPTPTPCASPSNNIALASNGSTAVASTSANASFLAGGAIDGEHDGNTWGSNGGWNDRSRGVFPDDIQVNFNTNQTIREIDVYTLKDDFNSGSTVNDTTTFTSYGITSFNVQYWTGAAWVDVPGGAVVGNNLVKRKFIFPDITTDRIRVVVNDSADHLYSRVVEIEAFACAPIHVSCVNPGGTGGCFSTIQAAVNAAVPGEQVNVQPGTYDEDVNIPVAGLKLIGAGAGSTNIRGPIGGSVATVAVAGNNVTVAGFTITRLGNNTTDWNNPNLNTVGVSVQGLGISGMLIRDNIITGNRSGIDVNNSNGHTVRNNVIDFNRTGFIYGNQTDNQTVVENFITNNWTVGVLFLDRSGAGVPPQQALHSTFSNNNISANWYGQIVDRQSGGTLPAPATSNYKNFRGNWYGTTSPVITTANSAEPGYAAQIPVAYGGSATPPGGQPDIAGPASANFQITPLLQSGTDTNVETTPGRGTFGFQGVANTVVVSPGNQNGWVFFDDLPGTGSGSGGFEAGPATPPQGSGSAFLQVDATGRFALATGGYSGTRMDDLLAFLYGSYMNGNANQAASIAFQFDIDYDLNDAATAYSGRLVYEPGLLTNLPQNVWQNWDARAGVWYGTRTTVTVNNVAGVTQPCQMATPCTYAQVLALFPNAGVWNGGGGLIFKAGGPVGSNFDGNVDAFTLRHNGALINYNFENVP